MHLVIYFCGTRHPGFNFYEKNDYLDAPHIRTLFVKGCDEPEVCGSAISPDLRTFAQRFVQGLFKQSGTEENKAWVLEMTILESLGVSLQNTSNHLSDINEANPIESLTLAGYSRGAVTCFEVARQLHTIASEIPIDIVSDQPVPGNYYPGFYTNAGRIADCRDLSNLKHVSIILAAYTGARYDQKDKKLYTFFHRTFFTQVVPKLPHTTHRDLIVIPRESHHEDVLNSPDGSEHMHMQLAKYLNRKNLICDATVEKQTNLARAQYTTTPAPAKLFAQRARVQSFFGLSTEQAYQNLDPLHPTVGLREGYTFEQDETLLDWWNKHDKQTSSCFGLTNEALIHSIKCTNLNDIEAMTSLFSETDTWLLLKENKTSSRYCLVEALRNNLEDKLIHQMDVRPLDLLRLKRHHLEATNYYLTCWQSMGHMIDPKSDETHALESAFVEHDKTSFSRENDQTLLIALDAWIEKKQASKSERWEGIIEIRQHLSGVIKNSSELLRSELDTLEAPEEKAPPFNCDRLNTNSTMHL